MSYLDQEDKLYGHLTSALDMLNLALRESSKMCELYGQGEYERNEEILEAQQAVKRIVQQF